MDRVMSIIINNLFLNNLNAFRIYTETKGYIYIWRKSIMIYIYDFVLVQYFLLDYIRLY